MLDLGHPTRKQAFRLPSGHYSHGLLEAVVIERVDVYPLKSGKCPIVSAVFGMFTGGTLVTERWHFLRDE